jgi:hypothetical protein
MPHPHNARTAEGFHKASLLAKKMLPSGRLSQRSKVSRLQLSEFHALEKGMPHFALRGLGAYSISASSDGSTQIPRCAIFLAQAASSGSAA